MRIPRYQKVDTYWLVKRRRWELDRLSRPSSGDVSANSVRRTPKVAAKLILPHMVIYTPGIHGVSLSFLFYFLQCPLFSVRAPE